MVITFFCFSVTCRFFCVSVGGVRGGGGWVRFNGYHLF